MKSDKALAYSFFVFGLAVIVWVVTAIPVVP